MSKVNIAPVGTDPVELTVDEPQEITEGMKDWETAILSLQRNGDIIILDRLIAEKQAALLATGKRVSAEANILGALTQKGLEQAVQALLSARAELQNAPLATVEYADDSSDS